MSYRRYPPLVPQIPPVVCIHTPPIGLKLRQRKAEWALAPAFTRARDSGFYGYLLSQPAAWMRVIDGRPSIVGMIAEEGGSLLNNDSDFFIIKCLLQIIYTMIW